jgi:hypothetical protein
MIKKTGRVKFVNIAIVVACTMAGFLIRECLHRQKNPKPIAEVQINKAEKDEAYYLKSVSSMLESDRFYGCACTRSDVEFKEKKFKRWVKKNIPPHYRIVLNPSKIETNTDGTVKQLYSAVVLRIN